MRKIFWIFVFILVTGMILTAAGTAFAGEPAPRIILYTWYWSIGEDDLLQIGSLDEEGVLRTLSGKYSEMGWPYEQKEQLEYLSHTEKFSEIDSLDSSELFSVKSLIYSVEDQGRDPVYAAEDAGNEESYAVRYSKEGEPEFILLGISGETIFENTNPDAQALYLRLRRLFPGVISYAYDPWMGPAGFTPMPVGEFLGIDPEAAATAEIEGGLIDCEAGYIPLEMTEEDKAELISLLSSAMVTGKADSVMSTGNIYSYTLTDPQGKLIGSIDFDEGLIVTNDGRYKFAAP